MDTRLNICKWSGLIPTSCGETKRFIQARVKFFKNVDINVDKNVYKNVDTNKRIAPKGDITFSERFTISLDCEMNFQMFPFDSQACPVTIESYAYAESEVHFEWRILDGKSPIEYSPGMGLSDFVQGRDPWTTNFPVPDFSFFRPWTVLVRRSMVQGVKFIKYNCTSEYSAGLYSCPRIRFFT